MLKITGKVKEKNREFSSTQVGASEAVGKAVYNFGIKNIQDADLYIDPDDPSYGRQALDDMHVTVKFGLHTNDHEEVQMVIGGFGPVHVGLGNVAKFRSEKYDVLIVEIESDDLVRMNKLISNNLECTDTHPVYKPHMTIAYVKKGKCEDLIKSSEFNELSFNTSWVTFSDQSGGKYNILIT